MAGRLMPTPQGSWSLNVLHWLDHDGKFDPFTIPDYVDIVGDGDLGVTLEVRTMGIPDTGRGLRWVTR